MKSIVLTPIQAEYIFHSVEENGTEELRGIFSKANIFKRKSPLKITVSAKSIQWILDEAKSQSNYFQGFISDYQDEELNEYWSDELRSYRFALKSLKNLTQKLTP